MLTSFDLLNHCHSLASVQSREDKYEMIHYFYIFTCLKHPSEQKMCRSKCMVMT